MMQHTPDDNAISQIYRQHATEQPPESLNRLILDAAAKEIENASTKVVPFPVRKTLLRRYTPMFATAALILLSVTVVLKLPTTSVPDYAHIPQKLTDDAVSSDTQTSKKKRELSPVMENSPLPAAAKPSEAKQKMSVAAPRHDKDRAAIMAPPLQRALPMAAPATEALMESIEPENFSSTAAGSGISANGAASSSFAEEEIAAEPILEAALWQQQLQQLLQQQQYQELARELDAFRQHYPDFVLHAPLAAWEKEQQQ